MVKFLLKEAVFGVLAPPITLFNTDISHYYIHARRDGILTLLGVGKGTFRRPRGGRKGYASRAAVAQRHTQRGQKKRAMDPRTSKIWVMRERGNS